MADPDLPASAQVTTDFLQLVRYGLRSADDPHIRDSLKIIDGLLKTEAPSGPVRHRYNDDGYGEHDDGGAFDGEDADGVWPLFFRAVQTLERSLAEQILDLHDEAAR
jgi:glucoamylase